MDIDYHIQNVDWNAIRPADGQFVFVSMDASATDPSPSQDAFTLVAAGELYAPILIDDE